MELHDGQLSITDHGSGIDDEDRPHVFERFYWSPNARGTPGSGSGSPSWRMLRAMSEVSSRPKPGRMVGRACGSAYHSQAPGFLAAPEIEITLATGVRKRNHHRTDPSRTVVRPAVRQPIPARPARGRFSQGYHMRGMIDGCRTAPRTAERVPAGSPLPGPPGTLVAPREPRQPPCRGSRGLIRSRVVTSRRLRAAPKSPAS